MTRALALRPIAYALRMDAFTAAAALSAAATALVVTTEFIVVGLLPQMARDLTISIGDAGRFVSWFAVASAVGGPVLTIAVSQVAARRVMASVLLIFAVGNLAVALTPNYATIVGVRIVQGAALPVLVSVGSAAVAQLAGPARAGRAVALIYVGVVVGLVLAVPGGVIMAGAAGWPATFLGIGILSAIAAAVTIAWFPRIAWPRPTPLARQATIVGQPVVQAHLLLSAVLAAAMFTAYTYLSAFLETSARFKEPHVAVALMGFGLAGVPGNWLAGRFVDRGPTTATAGVALLLMLSMAATVLVSDRPSLLLPALGVWGAAHAAGFLVCQVRVMRVAPAAPALAASLNISAANVGIAAGAIAGGWIVEHQGIGAVGLGGAALAAVALGIAIMLRRAVPAIG